MIFKQVNPDEYIGVITVDPIYSGGVNLVSTENVGDALFDRYKLDDSITAYSISHLNNLTVDNKTPEVCSYSNGVVTKIKKGNAKLGFRNNGISKFIKLAFNEEDAYQYVLKSFVDGSVGKMSLDFINLKIDIEKDLNYYNKNTYPECVADGGIVRNPNCWAKDYDLSGVPVTHLYGGFCGGGAMITKRHLAVTEHYERIDKTGMVVRFVGNDGVIVERHVIAQTRGSEKPYSVIRTYPYLPDICILLLNQDVPDNVKVYPVTGDWFDVYTDTNPGYCDILYACAFLALNQNRQVRFTMGHFYQKDYRLYERPDTDTINGVTYDLPSVQNIQTNNYQILDNPTFQFIPIVGDSGSPSFIACQNNDLILASEYTSPYGGTFYKKGLLDVLVLEVDDRAGISTGYTVTESTDPRIW